MPELLMGDEAVGVAAIDAGISGAFSYPGTPATEIFECIEDRAGDGGRVNARWSPNEKVAYEEALGMSFTGRRAIVSMKHVGLNVAADPFMSSALTGAVGGLVLAVADDPGMHSSQNEQDSRFFGDFAHIAIFEPATQQEAYDMTRRAFELSERVGLPVMIRLVTRLSHSRGIVQRGEAAQVATNGRGRGEPNNWTLLPVNARRRFRRLNDLQRNLLDISEHSPFNRLTLRGPVGIIACGVANNYVQEVIGDASEYSLLKICEYPAPAEAVRRIVHHCREVLVVEDGYPFVERQIVGLLGVPGKSIRGKLSGALPSSGEMTPESVAAALGQETPQPYVPLDDLPGRPPVLCDGCPHCDSFSAIMEAVAGMEPMLFSDIGCYTLGAGAPYHAVHACVDMGASISMAHGAAKAGAHPVLCTIGDSTFTHSGMTSLLGAIHEDANMTVLILDNATVAMTGTQDTFATGETLLRILRGLGVAEDHLVHVRPQPRTRHELAEIIRREVNHHGLSVIVATRPCIHLKRRGKGKPVEATA